MQAYSMKCLTKREMKDHKSIAMQESTQSIEAAGLTVTQEIHAYMVRN